MFDWAAPTLDALWHNGLAAIPLVVLAAGALRFLPCLPATRHTIWATVLIWLLGSPFLPNAPVDLAARFNAATGTSINPKSASAGDSDPNPDPSSVADAKPRTLTTRLAQRDARRQSENPPAVVHRTRDPAPRIAEMSSGVLPPPRSAVRAESPAPDKLARAWETAGPRSHLNDSSGLVTTRVRRVAPNRPSPESRKPDAALLPRNLEPRKHASPATTIAPNAAKNPEVATRPAQATQRAGDTLELTPPLAKQVPARAPDEVRAWKQWVAGILAMGNAIGRLPALPHTVWLAGVGMLLLLAAAKVIAFHHRLQKAWPAPREVLELVKESCGALGIAGPPQVLMVDGRLSPMVWCGVRPRLILPARLWEQLDDLGRKAVVCHELAHIRRKDHRMAWLESAIGMIYWWHPLVWWVRGRLHAEAENCCDAWVVALLPKTRRAYATALLKTREYLSGDESSVPALGIGITPGRARLFARRLTMVMTESVRPRLSISGLSLVLLVAACGWITSPARSCPEEEEAAKTAAKAAGMAPCATAGKAPCANTAVKAADSPCSTPCAKAKSQAAEKELTSFEKHMAERANAGVPVAAPAGAPPAEGPAVPVLAEAFPGGIVRVSQRSDARARRIAELESELARLEKQIESISEALDEQQQASEDDNGDESEKGDETRRPRAPRALIPSMPRHPHAQPMPPLEPRAPLPPMPRGMGHGPGAAPMPLPRPGQSWAEVSGEKAEWRTYKLSKGKLEDFTRFMSRSDVPIYVRAQPEAIEIQASPRQHEVFHAFISIVDPSEERGPGAGLFGAGPMLAFAQELTHGCGKGCARDCGRCRQAGELRAMAEDLRAHARAEAVELRAKTRGEAERIRAQAREEAEKARARLRRHARDARSEARDHHELIEGLERQSQVLAEVADSYREQAERIRERAEAVSERVEKSEDQAEAAQAYRLHVESLERSAEELNRQAEELQRQVETIEQQAREIDENARKLEEHAEDLDERAEAVREAVDSLESGVQPTPELVDSVLALVGGIENMVSTTTMEAIEEAVSAVIHPSPAEIEPAMMAPGEAMPANEEPAPPESVEGADEDD